MVKLFWSMALLGLSLILAESKAVSLNLLAEASVQLPDDFTYTYAQGQLDAPSIILFAQKNGCKLRFESAGTIVPAEEFERLNPAKMVKNLYREYQDYEPLDFSAPEFYEIGKLKAVRTEGSILLNGRRGYLRVNTLNLPHVMLHVLEYAAYKDQNYKELCFEHTQEIISSLKPLEIAN